MADMVNPILACIEESTPTDPHKPNIAQRFGMYVEPYISTVFDVHRFFRMSIKGYSSRLILRTDR